jgi:activator of 2-hydroxyglutaryl-CoA dehydratase
MNTLKLGVDLGSTTAKLIVLDALGKQVYSIYRRHHAETRATLQEMLSEIQGCLGDVEVSVMFTGSAGMGISESCGLPFLQEVIAAAEVIKRFPNVHTLIDIGGEDAKMIFFEPGLPPDIRMNGSCAGGTGAFIDVAAFDCQSDAGGSRLASTVHPLRALRCSRTDVQNLLNRDIHMLISTSVFSCSY